MPTAARVLRRCPGCGPCSLVCGSNGLCKDCPWGWEGAAAMWSSSRLLEQPSRMCWASCSSKALQPHPRLKAMSLALPCELGHLERSREGQVHGHKENASPCARSGS